jgi:hypothetical protein
MLEQELLEIVLGIFDNFTLMIVINLLTIVFGERFEAFSTQKEYTNFR